MLRLGHSRRSCTAICVLPPGHIPALQVCQQEGKLQKWAWQSLRLCSEQDEQGAACRTEWVMRAGAGFTPCCKSLNLHHLLVIKRLLICARKTPELKNVKTDPRIMMCGSHKSWLHGTTSLLLTEQRHLIPFKTIREGVKKNLLKSGQADRLGRPPPPPKQSGKCEKFSTSCHIWGYFAIL